MSIKIAVESGKMIWKEIGHDVLKKGSATLVTEGVKAVLEIVKKRKLRKDDYEFDRWKKEQEPEKDSDEDEDKAVKDEAPAEPDPPKKEAPGDSKPDEPEDSKPDEPEDSKPGEPDEEE